MPIISLPNELWHEISADCNTDTRRAIAETSHALRRVILGGPYGIHQTRLVVDYLRTVSTVEEPTKDRVLLESCTMRLERTR